MQNNLEHKPRSARHQVQVIGRLRVDVGGGASETCLCNTLNMSLSGVLVETGTMLAVGSVLSYSFSLPGVERIIEITGEVMRRSVAGPGTGLKAEGTLKPGKTEVVGAAGATGEPLNWYGIKFLELIDEDRDELERFLLA